MSLSPWPRMPRELTSELSRYENGEREASVSTLIRMADYFGVTIDYLVGRSDAR